MASTVLGINPDAVAVEGYRCKLQELSDVITRHSPRFRRIALGRLGNVADAEDAVQDALLSALTHVDQFQGRAKMSTWLTTIVINSARMKLRRRLPQVQVGLDETSEEQNLGLADVVSDTRPSPEDACRQREIAERWPVRLLGSPLRCGQPLTCATSTAMLAVIASLVFCTAALAQMPINPWKKAAPFPMPDEELYGTAVNGKMYVIGGWDDGKAAGINYEYDPA